ncbi:protein WVD2-like 4 isoform X3 [Carica papaya]|uniref:protein WVD2-like 4 isoform X3 n=1 Tax=Carica papaya TaxID=3649 RepID=UPI000B8C7DBA|nr:protein WVD2-like 4 isoform X3 [Carica papaya]
MSQKEQSKSNVGLSKNGKLAKDKPNLKGSAPFLRNQKPKVLSQSLSFPARGNHADALKKSIDGHPLKNGVKHGQENGAKAHHALSSNGLVTSVSRSNYPNKRAPTATNSKEAESNSAGIPSRRATLASVSSIRRAGPTKSNSVTAATDCLPSEVSEETDQNAKPEMTTLPSKDDEDAHSTTSTSTHGRRNSGSGFSFRLDERAEKRKEFFLKMEEKIHAKEIEKNNLQAKSKENQEAEIKQLRKSLTFKATPMPSFYKEPPPKVELKKIPTTRAKSPKLGRQKSSTAATNTSPEVAGVPSASPHLNREQSNSTKGIQPNGDNDNSGASKRPFKKSQSKLHPRDSPVNTKTEAKPVKPKPKSSAACSQNQEAASTAKPIDDLTFSSSIPKLEDAIAAPMAEMNPTQTDGPISSLANAEIMPLGVTVG